jgi:tRNA pseudouridine13 synthase
MDADRLPFVTADLPGIGGELKAEPADFVVEELPLYEPAGEGEHVYVRLTREGWTTRALQTELARLFGLREVDVGYAGMKDRHARVTQTFSLALHAIEEQAVADLICSSLPVEVAWTRRHRNKLKVGHLLGNRFRIVLHHPTAPTSAGALSCAQSVAQTLLAHGLPNFYGAQRFGARGDNAEQGRQVLLGGGPRKPWLRRLLLSAFQSSLFNQWLAERMQRGWFERLLTGDIAKKVDTGGLFVVEDAALEAPRFERGEIGYTGPIYGSRMRWAEGEPGQLEQSILAVSGIEAHHLQRAHLDGSRRPARLLLNDVVIEPHAEGLVFTFTLPKGAYATTLLREFTKADAPIEEEHFLEE